MKVLLLAKKKKKKKELTPIFPKILNLLIKIEIDASKVAWKIILFIFVEKRRVAD